ncbi:hypothetical protein EBN03_08470 [Nocardia stercoris]|uniref:Uncharacterized protein n=2 Tax=Nocardia stercoris TaxID=2483361 RepID=A0A3M2L685_9NOCA|nr:hypothetical protein EBN03_08470 [Nocardia stercoris]
MMPVFSTLVGTGATGQPHDVLSPHTSVPTPRGRQCPAGGIGERAVPENNGRARTANNTGPEQGREHQEGACSVRASTPLVHENLASVIIVVEDLDP